MPKRIEKSLLRQKLFYGIASKNDNLDSHLGGNTLLVSLLQTLPAYQQNWSSKQTEATISCLNNR